MMRFTVYSNNTIAVEMLSNGGPPEMEAQIATNEIVKIPPNRWGAEQGIIRGYAVKPTVDDEAACDGRFTHRWRRRWYGVCYRVELIEPDIVIGEQVETWIYEQDILPWLPADSIPNVTIKVTTVSDADNDITRRLDNDEWLSNLLNDDSED